MAASIFKAEREIKKRASFAMGRAIERHIRECGLVDTVEHIAFILQDLSIAEERDQPEGSDGCSGRIYEASEDLFGLAHDLRQATV